MENVPPWTCRRLPRRSLIDPNTVLAEVNRPRVRSRRLGLRRCKRCKRANPSNSMIDSFPDELLIEILARLSADEILNKATLVCHRWYHLIHSDAFVCAHFHRTCSGLLVEPCTGSSPVLVTATTQGQVEISQLSYRINIPIMCSCNGLALCLKQDGYRGIDEKNPFIFNPATKRTLRLPKFPVRRHRLIYSVGMAYAAASMAYKVVASYRVIKSGIIEHFVMLTVGVDKTWRHVALEGLSPEAKKLIMSVRTPLITGCFLHWVSKTLVVSLNVETENFTVTPTPALMFPQQRYFHLSTGEYISLLFPRGDNWSWEVWEMKPETWEWRKVLPKINLKAHKRKIQQFTSQKEDVLRPVAWVRYPEMLAFLFNGMSRYCIIYNLDTKEFEPVELSTARDYHYVVQHRNTLVRSGTVLR